MEYSNITIDAIKQFYFSNKKKYQTKVTDNNVTNLII